MSPVLLARKSLVEEVYQELELDPESVTLAENHTDADITEYSGKMNAFIISEAPVKKLLALFVYTYNEYFSVRDTCWFRWQSQYSSDESTYVNYRREKLFLVRDIMQQVRATRVPKYVTYSKSDPDVVVIDSENDLGLPLTTYDELEAFLEKLQELNFEIYKENLPAYDIKSILDSIPHYKKAVEHLTCKEAAAVGGEKTKLAAELASLKSKEPYVIAGVASDLRQCYNEYLVMLLFKRWGVSFEQKHSRFLVV